MSKNKDNSYTATVSVSVAPRCPTVRERLASQGIENWSVKYDCGGYHCRRTQAEDRYADLVWKISGAYGWTGKLYSVGAKRSEAQFTAGMTSVIVTFSVDK